MTAKTASINGVTRLHEFEINLSDFERVGATMQASARRSKLGFKPGQWPDNFMLSCGWCFRLFEIKRDRSHVYRHGDCMFTIKPT